MQELAWYLEPWSATIGGVFCGLMIMDMIQFAFLLKLRRAINVYDANYGDYD